MSTQQIPTVAQLTAARMQRWHQAAEPVQQEEQRAEESEQAAAHAPDDGSAPGDGSAPQGVRQDGEVAAASAHEGEAEEHRAEGAGEEGVGSGEAGSDEAGSDEAGSGESDGGEGDSEEGAVSSAEGGEADDEDPATTREPKSSGAGGSGVPAGRPVAVQTMEAARELLERSGLMLFAPHGSMASVPAPSLVEATLGGRNAAPTAAETATARSLLARMVAEGSAVPLNLLGAPTTTGEAPDFVASAAAFGYVFTLRGDKNWKQMPAASGAHSVSPLAVNTYGLLVENGPQTAATLVTELGKGLTETAVLRALGELWQQLRVIPVAQANGKPTVWEPITTRLQRQVKAGANAGVPTALSALISLYLGQAVLATEEEIETLLSPLSPRSKVRDVVHALVAAQQLETMTIAGRHHLYVAGELPEFAVEEQTAGARGERREERGPKLAEDGSRIRRMVRSTAPAGERARPFRPAGAGASRPRPGAGGFRKGASGGDRPGGRAGGRPGGFERGARPERPARFDRPWEERPRREGAAEGGEEARPTRPRREGFGAERGARGGAGFQGGGDRPAFRRGGDRPAFGRSGEGRRWEGRPGFGRTAEGAGERERPTRPWGDRPERGAGEAPARPRKRREGGAEGADRPKRPYAARSREDGGFPAKRPFRRDDGEGGGGGFRPRSPRVQEGGEGGAERPKFRRFDAPERGARPFRPKRMEAGADGGPERRAGEERGAGPRPPRPRFEGAGSAGAERRPARGGFAGGPRREGGAGRPQGGFAGGRGPKRFGGGASSGPGSDRGGSPGKSFGAGRSFGGGAGFGPRGLKAKDGADQPRGPRQDRRQGTEPGAGPFDKFKGGNKPWGKRPPARKTRPEEEQG